MTYDDVKTYLEPVLENLFGENSASAAEELDALLGRDDYEKYRDTSGDKDPPIDEGYKQELLMLTGPNAHAILKVIRIRKGLE